MKTTTKMVFGLWLTAAGLAACIGGAGAAGFRINTTASAPEGIWRLFPIGSIHRGEMVSVCAPPEAIVVWMRREDFIGPGSCPVTKAVPFLKPVVALPGDVVTVQKAGNLLVNGVALPHSRPLPHVPAWPPGIYKVKPGYVWLVSSFNPGSFDSRYFGPVSIRAIRAQAVPFAIQGNPEKLTLHPILKPEGEE